VKKVPITAGILLVVFSAACFAADVPKTINYQGMITDSEGNPLNGIHNFAFRIWNHPTSGQVRWFENHTGLTVEDGLLNVILGKSTPIDLDFTEDYWMSISVDAETMPERIELSSVLYALRAETAKLADSATVAVSAAAGGGWTDDGSVVRLSTSLDNVGIGLTNPNRKLYVVENMSGLSFPLKIDNPHSTFVTDATGILFSAGGGGADQLSTDRGKGALVYQLTDTWNRGSFHFLQDANIGTDNPTLSDAVMTIRNDGKVGIGTTDPSYKLDVRGDRIQLKEDGTGHWIAMRTDGSVLDFSFSGAHLYFQGNADGEHIFLNPSRNSNVGVGTITPTARLHAVGGDYGIKGKGNTAGAYFEDAAGHGHAYVGYSPRWRGIEAKGDSMGAAFGDNNGGTGFAWLGYGNRGVYAKGTEDGGYFEDLDGGGWARVGATDKKILGSGSDSFVQNHPADNTKVIVYTAIEGDEAATYTRGTARLVGGEARVTLGETFKWVTNPDLGLTAHVTPREECEGIFVVSLTTTEMVVKELRGGTSDAVFDYIVYGLRIGFEETSIVQEKTLEAYLPSMKDYRNLYSRQPQLRQYNALERFKRMNMDIGRPFFETGSARSLRDAIHEFDPAIDKLAGPDEM
jgi:hypothetical protein